MNSITRTRLLPLIMLGAMCAAFGDTPATKTEPVAKPAEQSAAATSPVQSSCQNSCDAAEAMCSSEVRRARSECSRRAANAGRDPFTMRNNDYSFFCGYFANGNGCGFGANSAACRSRFTHTHGVCVSAIQQNIASMRFDCFQTERTAQTYCRDELRSCKAECQ